ncbi:hypothetical protein [Bacillus benzoevorans]|uniref:Uncharacterized protein n=1 Tax=Bacillus benzoevorans TaxID=1456 RepID=A0A7X0HTX1_9BACI|nr:hypothetical protein [Bacillus benzoevorans]MBB6446716.1 hypothetical protein [Bacillus benzoevorans]
MKRVTYIYEWIADGELFSHIVEAILIDDYTLISMEDSGNELEVTRSKQPLIVEPNGIIRLTSGDDDFFIIPIELTDEGASLSGSDRHQDPENRKRHTGQLKPLGMPFFRVKLPTVV